MNRKHIGNFFNLFTNAENCSDRLCFTLRVIPILCDHDESLKNQLSEAFSEKRSIHDRRKILEQIRVSVFKHSFGGKYEFEYKCVLMLIDIWIETDYDIVYTNAEWLYEFMMKKKPTRSFLENEARSGSFDIETD